METKDAIALAAKEFRSDGRRALAALLGVASISTYRWKPDLPPMREFQLKALRPRWFKKG